MEGGSDNNVTGIRAQDNIGVVGSTRCGEGGGHPLVLEQSRCREPTRAQRSVRRRRRVPGWTEHSRTNGPRCMANRIIGTAENGIIFHGVFITRPPEMNIAETRILTPSGTTCSRRSVRARSAGPRSTATTATRRATTTCGGAGPPTRRARRSAATGGPATARAGRSASVAVLLTSNGSGDRPARVWGMTARSGLAPRESHECSPSVRTQCRNGVRRAGAARRLPSRLVFAPARTLSSRPGGRWRVLLGKQARHSGTLRAGAGDAAGPG